MVNLTKYRKFLLLICIDIFYYINWVVSTSNIWLILPKMLGQFNQENLVDKI